ncbi:MAG: hypothetical protein KAI24_18975, partial [Planctomycetes bacterium]|nr:hypothetical protein [Planctomycetota bacterium]
MKPRFAVRVRAIAESPSGPDAWDPPRYRALLHALDYQDADGVAEADLREMVLMALQDKEPNEAAEAV